MLAESLFQSGCLEDFSMDDASNPHVHATGYRGQTLSQAATPPIPTPERPGIKIKAVKARNLDQAYYYVHDSNNVDEGNVVRDHNHLEFWIFQAKNGTQYSHSYDETYLRFLEGSSEFGLSVCN
ncbi:MAG: hypothetical protein Q9183_006953 [Haloplaca sp. 2 TL-2023]